MPAGKRRQGKAHVERRLPRRPRRSTAAPVRARRTCAARARAIESAGGQAIRPTTMQWPAASSRRTWPSRATPRFERHARRTGFRRQLPTGAVNSKRSLLWSSEDWAALVSGQSQVRLPAECQRRRRSVPWQPVAMSKGRLSDFGVIAGAYPELTFSGPAVRRCLQSANS